MKTKHYDVCIVGGLGHVGLPLGLTPWHNLVNGLFYTTLINKLSIRYH